MTTTLLLLLFVHTLLVFCALQQARCELKAMQLYVREKYGEDVAADEVEAMVPTRPWVTAIDGWFYPGSLARKLAGATLEAVRGLGGVPEELAQLASTGRALAPLTLSPLADTLDMLAFDEGLAPKAEAVPEVASDPYME